MTIGTEIPASSGHAVVELRSVTKQYTSRHNSPHTVLSDISLVLQPGTCLGLVGESGSGKSTIARILAGLEFANEGEVIVGGQKLHPRRRGGRQARRLRAQTVQMVFQDPNSSLDPLQTVGSALHEILALHRRDKGNESGRVDDLLRLVGLDAHVRDAKPVALSGGQRQRAAIARALAANPAAIILDESVAALDVSIQAQIINLLTDLRKHTGMAYLFISHDLAVIRQVADQVIVLQQGHIVEEGPTDRVLDAPQHPYTRKLRDSVPRPGWRPSRAAERTAAGT